MRATRDEQIQAERVTAAVDQLVRDPDAVLELSGPGAAEALAAARQMARLPALLGPPDPAFEQRLMHRVRRADKPSRRTPWFRVGWAVAGLVAALLVVMLLTPAGQTAVAGLMAVFDLGRTNVQIAPVYTPTTLPTTAIDGGHAVQQDLTLQEAQDLVSFTIPQPSYLPPGFRLERVHSYQYPDLPAWMPQPFFVELLYYDSEGEELLLRVYSITLGDSASIASLNLRAPPIQRAEDVDVNGRPGALLWQDHGRSGAVWRELVWEQDDLILALSSVHLDEGELLQIARSFDGKAP
jgi:ElaB/YqjD/DUF883 family membrane-anchored ribosome-binding protein